MTLNCYEPYRPPYAIDFFHLNLFVIENILVLFAHSFHIHCDKIN